MTTRNLRLQLLSSALAGTIGVFLPSSAAHAATGSGPAMSSATAATAPQAGTGITASSAVSAGAATERQGDESIRPFHFHASDADLADLRRRIAATRFPSQELVADASQGVQLATLQKLAGYWAKDYDWRRFETRLNALPQFITRIDGVDVHFIHVRSKEPHAMPLIITHGWPGSIVEELKIIDALTNPVAHGGRASDAFDLVIPSMPGFGFSGKPTETGWDTLRMARAFTVLMKRLGYQRFAASGGDWGAPITEQMALQDPSALIGMHTNLPFAMPDEIATALHSGKPAPAGLSADEQRAYDQIDYLIKHGLAYAQEMGNRPQTLYGVDDSPIGLAAWIIDHDIESYKLIARVFDGQSEGLSRDDVLDNITLYWLTRTGVSSSRIYWENKLPFFVPLGVKVPVAVSAYPDEMYQSPKSWAERAYPRLIHYNRLPKGGHFAAWEQPQSFAEELRAAFRSLR